MEKNYKKNTKMAAFLKKNMYYFIMAICVVAIGTMVTVALVNNNSVIDDPTIGGGTDLPDDPTIKPDPDQPTISDPMVFALPVAGGKVIQNYSMDALVFNTTLNHYSVHNGIDFGGAANTPVAAVYEGVVESIIENELEGKVITILHADNIRSSYGSLHETKVSVGQKVTKGMEIGTIGITASNEVLDGPHVHFVVTKNNALVDPNTYFANGDK